MSWPSCSVRREFALLFLPQFAAPALTNVLTKKRGEAGTLDKPRHIKNRSLNVSWDIGREETGTKEKHEKLTFMAD